MTTSDAPPDPGDSVAPEAKDTQPPGKRGGATLIAEDLLNGETNTKVADYGPPLFDERESTATQAARVLSEVIHLKPEAAVPLVDKFVKALLSTNRRVVQTGAEALPAIAKIAPARVAKHLDRLKDSYAQTLPSGKDGIVRTFTNLCLASVAYQKRLEPTLCQALGEAEPKVLQKWTEIVLPALKGEPHASAREVVEGRLYDLPKAVAQKIAAQLGVKLRPRR